MNYDVHGKRLPIPSFFQVYNYGGGNGDKDREIVYAELTGDTPALINYYYINNNIPHSFQSHAFDDLSSYSKIGDVYNDIRNMLIKKGEIYNGYKPKKYDFNSKVFLLDSGAFNIVKYVAKKVNYKFDKFLDELIIQMKEYYNFANNLKIDIVVSFDLGGKYTEKDGESSDVELKKFFNAMNTDEVNNILLEETIKYLKDNPDYYPNVLATIHGDLQEDYKKCTEFVLSLEKKHSYKFWGFALGGIASYKKLDKSWYKDIDFNETGKKDYISTVGPARAAKIVRGLIADNRPIHALGCGGYPNIATNYFSGATSFDAASPVRRVGDGNEKSTKYVFSTTSPSDAKFSKYFVGGINSNNTLRKEPCQYIDINLVDDKMDLCGCDVCKEANNVNRIKKLYSIKATDSEANYFSRQLMGLHAVRQHRKLCEVISNYSSIQDFSKDYPNNLNLGLVIIFEQL